MKLELFEVDDYEWNTRQNFSEISHGCSGEFIFKFAKTKCDLIQCSRERVLWKGFEAFLLFVQNIADGTKKESRTKKFDQNL